MNISVQNISIVDLEVEAIVNAANNSLLGGGGVDGVIHAHAGRDLLEECRQLGGCETGEAKLTKGYNLKAKYVIHAVGPIWRGGNRNEAILLANCYQRSLDLAVEHNIRSIAFPAISTGAYSYPMSEAAEIAVRTVVSGIANKDINVVFAVMGRKAEKVFRLALEKYTTQ